MTIITGAEYRANQGKYIKRAQEGERVIISSRGKYVELKPVAEEDKGVMEFSKAMSFFTVAHKFMKGYKEEDYVTLKSRRDIDKWFDSL